MSVDEETFTKRITQLIAIWANGNDYEQHLAWQLGRVFDVVLLEADLNSYEDPRIKKALAMYDQAFPDQHAGPCSHVACQMARTLRRT